MTGCQKEGRRIVGFQFSSYAGLQGMRNPEHHPSSCRMRDQSGPHELGSDVRETHPLPAFESYYCRRKDGDWEGHVHTNEKHT
mmetsp:Transcript_10615/g.22134  ORF Transcript_10615/g.22134 Transcript_10615/m.22134 type:complete len:83 (-) Transcript_10615:160-408(-)